MHCSLWKVWQGSVVKQWPLWCTVLCGRFDWFQQWNSDHCDALCSVEGLTGFSSETVTIMMHCALWKVWQGSYSPVDPGISNLNFIFQQSQISDLLVLQLKDSVTRQAGSCYSKHCIKSRKLVSFVEKCWSWMYEEWFELQCSCLRWSLCVCVHWVPISEWFQSASDFSMFCLLNLFHWCRRLSSYCAAWNAYMV